MGYSRTVLVYVLALCAALLFGVGSVVQQRVAFDAPPGKTLRPSLLLWLVRQPAWLIGVGTAFVGNGFSAAALGMGTVALVQPLLVVRLLFALPLAAAWVRQRLSLRDWLGAAATAGGLAVFLAVGRPQEGAREAGGLFSWLFTGIAIAALTVFLVGMARKLSPAHEAPMLGAGAGMLFGLQSGLTHTAIVTLTDSGLGAMLLNPATYAVAVTAILGTLLAQSAYEMAPLQSSYPALAAIEPLAGIGVGVGVLGASISLGTVPLALEIGGLVVMTLGIFLLATSPLVTGREQVMRQRQSEELAYRMEQDIDRDLTGMERELAELRRGGGDHTDRLVHRLDERDQRVQSCLQKLSEYNAQALEDGKAAAQQAAKEGPRAEEHERLMEGWYRESVDREQSLRARAEGLTAELQNLRR